MSGTSHERGHTHVADLIASAFTLDRAVTGRVIAALAWAPGLPPAATTRSPSRSSACAATACSWNMTPSGPATFEPLRLVPSDKVVVLGLVSTKIPDLGVADDLLRRIDAAERNVAAERLALSTQCGFASDFRGNPLSQDDQWRKLELVASVSQRARACGPVT